MWPFKKKPIEERKPVNVKTIIADVKMKDGIDIKLTEDGYVFDTGDGLRFVRKADKELFYSRRVKSGFLHSGNTAYPLIQILEIEFTYRDKLID